MNRQRILNIIVFAALIALVISYAQHRVRRGSEVPEKTAETALAVGEALPRLIDLGSDNCIPCQRMAPILEELREEYAGRAEVLFVDIRQNPEEGRRYGIRVIPTQVFFDREGNEIWRHEGFLSREEIVDRFARMGVE